MPRARGAYLSGLAGAAALLLLGSGRVDAQTAAHGTLTVRVTITSSVAIVFNPERGDGTWTLAQSNGDSFVFANVGDRSGIAAIQLAVNSVGPPQPVQVAGEPEYGTAPARLATTALTRRLWLQGMGCQAPGPAPIQNKGCEGGGKDSQESQMRASPAGVWVPATIKIAAQRTRPRKS
jgi:hypothetical protein